MLYNVIGCVQPYIQTHNIERISDDFANILSFLGEILPFFYTIAVIVTNISLILGGLIYLLDSQEKNGKEMIFRSLSMIFLFIFIFNDIIFTNNSLSNDLGGIEELGSYILLYLLYSFATLSLIMFIVNCGLYLINPNPKTVKGIKKSIVCIFTALLPLGFNFPSFPTWR